MTPKPDLLDDWTVIELLIFHERFGPYFTSSIEKCFIFLRNELNIRSSEYPFGLGDEKSKNFLPITRKECELIVFFTNSYDDLPGVSREVKLGITLPILNFHFRNAIDSKIETLLPRVLMHNNYQPKKPQLWKAMTIEEVMNEIPPEVGPL